MIEVNVNPCLEETNGFLKKLLENMLDGMFKLTIDKIFKIRDSHDHSCTNNYVDSDDLGNDNDNWGWEFLRNVYFHRQQVNRKFNKRIIVY